MRGSRPLVAHWSTSPIHLDRSATARHLAETPVAVRSAHAGASARAWHQSSRLGACLSPWTLRCLTTDAPYRVRLGGNGGPFDLFSRLPFVLPIRLLDLILIETWSVGGLMNNLRRVASGMRVPENCASSASGKCRGSVVARVDSAARQRCFSYLTATCHALCVDIAQWPARVHVEHKRSFEQLTAGQLM